MKRCCLCQAKQHVWSSCKIIANGNSPASQTVQFSLCVIKTFKMRNLFSLAAVANSHPNINRVKIIIINTAIMQVFSTFIKVARYGTHSARALVRICSFRFPVIDSGSCNELEPPCLSLDWTPRLEMVYIFSVCCIVWYQNQRSYSKVPCHFKNNMRPEAPWIRNN